MNCEIKPGTHSHDAISPDEFNLKRHRPIIKKRIETETYKFLSEIYDEEMIILLSKHGISAAAIAEYTRAMRATRIYLMLFGLKEDQRFQKTNKH